MHTVRDICIATTPQGKQYIAQIQIGLVMTMQVVVSYFTKFVHMTSLHKWSLAKKSHHCQNLIDGWVWFESRACRRWPQGYLFGG